MKDLVIIGCGYAGLWAAISAARMREKDNFNALTITVINQHPYHANRVCNYQNDLDANIFDANEILDLVGVNFVVADVVSINPKQQSLCLSKDNQLSQLDYDVLIIAAGSEMYYPDVPGLKAFSFNIGDYEAAKRLYQHLETACSRNICIIGAGFCGLELASELASTRKNNAIYLIDRHEVGGALGDNPKSYINNVLTSHHICSLSNKQIKQITKQGVYFTDGDCIETDTVIWAGGLVANSTHQFFAVTKDALNRLHTNAYLQLPHYAHIFVAGDMASVKVDDEHKAFMSCQHARPQGAVAGYNAVMQLMSKPMQKYSQPNYVTCLDLGAEQALFTKGWDRQIVATGKQAKALKMSINQQRITPPKLLSKAALYQSVAELL